MFIQASLSVSIKLRKLNELRLSRSAADASGMSGGIYQDRMKCVEDANRKCASCVAISVIITTAEVVYATGKIYTASQQGEPPDCWT